MSQNQRILNYIQDFGSITTLQAFSDLGVTRLASRIHDLRKAGNNIASDKIVVKNRYGEDCHISRYFLVGGAEDGK